MLTSHIIPSRLNNVVDKAREWIKNKYETYWDWTTESFSSVLAYFERYFILFTSSSTCIHSQNAKPEKCEEEVSSLISWFGSIMRPKMKESGREACWCDEKRSTKGFQLQVFHEETTTSRLCLLHPPGWYLWSVCVGRRKWIFEGFLRIFFHFSISLFVIYFAKFSILQDGIRKNFEWKVVGGDSEERPTKHSQNGEQSDKNGNSKIFFNETNSFRSLWGSRQYFVKSLWSRETVCWFKNSLVVCLCVEWRGTRARRRKGWAMKTNDHN